MVLKKLSTGSDDFEKIIRNNFYYVDKTELICEVVENFAEVTLFTRPRRFGKSLNMSMLKAFFEIGTDPDLFVGLKISEHTEICQKHLGKYPVIAISLKGVSQNNYDDARDGLSAIIASETACHSYLLSSKHLNTYDKKQLEILLSGELNTVVLSRSLLTLSNLLHKHHNADVIILIDEYDVPLSKANTFGYYDEMVSLIRNLFDNALKSNHNLAFSVLTGCLRVSKESIFTGLNNTRTYSVLDGRYASYFGFTHEETETLLKDYGLASYLGVFRDWYDGYRFGNVSIFCPWDVICYCYDLLHDPESLPRNYWVNTSSNDIIKKFINKANETTKYEIEELLAGKTLVKTINQELTYSEIDESLNNLWSGLFMSGYLTCAKTYGIGNPYDVSEDWGKTIELKIPNKEIMSIIKDQILVKFHESAKENPSKLIGFCEDFLNGNFTNAENVFREYLQDSISIRDTFARDDLKENFYHGMLLGLLQCKEDWIIRSNRESGSGFSDISIFHRKKEIGIVIELKYAADGNLSNGCAKALEQINEKDYTKELMTMGAVKILLYGIACYQKNCCIQMKEVSLQGQMQQIQNMNLF